MRKSVIAACVMVIMFLVLTALSSEVALANGKHTETRYSSNSSVRTIVSVFGGLIGLLGIAVAFKSVVEKAEVQVSLAQHKKMVMKGVSQGVVITLIGAAVLIAAMYLLPDKESQSETTGKTLQFGPGGAPVGAGR